MLVDGIKTVSQAAIADEVMAAVVTMAVRAVVAQHMAAQKVFAGRQVLGQLLGHLKTTVNNGAGIKRIALGAGRPVV